MQQQAPVSFEINIDKAPCAAAPEVKKRLETTNRRQLTREQIDDRQSKAAQARQAAIEKSKHTASEACEKVQMTRERRTSEDRAQEERAAAELSSKLQIADEKRHVQISCIQDKARTHNERVNKRIKDCATKQQTDADAKKAELDEKLKKATERHEAQLDAVK